MLHTYAIGLHDKVLYEGTSLRYTRWDLEPAAVVRRYRVEIYIKDSTGVLKDTDIYSSYLRIAPSGTECDLEDTEVHGGNLVCKKTSETIGSGTYNAFDSKREWTISPQSDGGAPTPHKGILLHFRSFDLECDC